MLTKDINHLHRLALLLTGDQSRAEQCLVSGLEDCVGENPAFRHWSHRWSKRTIIKNAIKIVRPAPGETRNALPICTAESEPESETEAILPTITQLSPFDRFVFVIAVLEGYSDGECSAMLRCNSEEVTRARMRMLETMGSPNRPAGAAKK